MSNLKLVLLGLVMMVVIMSNSACIIDIAESTDSSAMNVAPSGLRNADLTGSYVAAAFNRNIVSNKHYGFGEVQFDGAGTTKAANLVTGKYDSAKYNLKPSGELVVSRKRNNGQLHSESAMVSSDASTIIATTKRSIAMMIKKATNYPPNSLVGSYTTLGLDSIATKTTPKVRGWSPTNYQFEDNGKVVLSPAFGRYASMNQRYSIAADGKVLINEDTKGRLSADKNLLLLTTKREDCATFSVAVRRGDNHTNTSVAGSYALCCFSFTELAGVKVGNGVLTLKSDGAFSITLNGKTERGSYTAYKHGNMEFKYDNNKKISSVISANGGTIIFYKYKFMSGTSPEFHVAIRM